MVYYHGHLQILSWFVRHQIRKALHEKLHCFLVCKFHVSVISKTTLSQGAKRQTNKQKLNFASNAPMRRWSNNKWSRRLARENEWKHNEVVFIVDWMTWHELFKQSDWMIIRHEVLKPIRKDDKTYGHDSINIRLETRSLGMRNTWNQVM